MNYKNEKPKRKSEKPKSNHNCPPVTLPGESRKCENRRLNFAAGSPYLRFDLNLDVYFFNNQVDFAVISQVCDSLGYRVISPQELAAISAQLAGAGICPMLVWTNNNGVPTLAYVFPGDPNPVRIVTTPSLLCRAYHFCTANNSMLGRDIK